ncbi:MAG TPA: S8 family peptidase [Burkholderiales bacterium]|nr:S8 family peptidase [Burkholderiales bacterium]
MAQTQPFRSPRQIIPRRTIPERDRQEHGNTLRRQVDELRPAAAAAVEAQRDVGVEAGYGLQVAFESFPDIELAFESLARVRSGIELMNVRHEDTVTYANVFVPEGRLEHFERLIEEYLSERRDSAGRARDHKSLINTIRAIRAARLRDLWTDDPAVFPADPDETFWWEVWLPVRGDRSRSVTDFRRLMQLQDVPVAAGELEFPERTVVLAYTSAAQMTLSAMTLNSIGELRRAKDTAEFFDSMPLEEQPEWAEDLLARIRIPNPEEDVPHVCVLDTGVNSGHPLLTDALAAADQHTVEPGWGTDDNDGHGTNMAGLALLGDLTAALATRDPVIVRHRLEAVKLLPHDGYNGGDAKHHGYITIEAVSRPEVTAPDRARVFEMAVTARDNRDRGRPSAWSAAIDRLAVDAESAGATPRLIVVSAGNVTDSNAWALYPDSNTTDGIHDPAQAWNALTIGAFTNYVNITEPDMGGYQPIAAGGGLSPFSTTSATWQTYWPLKPDVMFEGGNAAEDDISAVWTASLSLLTTHHVPAQRLFTTANATSAATALAARMAAQLMAEYPDLRPETIRGMVVHSAEWTHEMRRMFFPAGRAPSKADYVNLVRHCGFGVPDLDRARWSASNALTLIVEESLQPFEREGSAQPKMRDMHFYELPWPLGELEALGETQVEMRVTLSYFIEPNPSERGPRSRYRYESHGLRFDVKRPLESVEEFQQRVNAAARDEEEGTRVAGDDPQWDIGKSGRHRGSIHSDTWRGRAADLASRGAIAIYPALGWWKTRTALERFNQSAPYSLLVSIRAPGVDVDLYTAVANRVGVAIDIQH